MTDASRKAILRRRAGGQTDLTSISLTNGTLALNDALKESVWTINSSQMVGIATATEQGLTADRFPIRVRLATPPAAGYVSKVETCIRYWTVTDIAGVTLSFARKPLSSVVQVKNLYTVMPDLDDIVWDFIYTNADKKLKVEQDVKITAAGTEIYALLCVANPTPETAAAILSKMIALFKTAIEVGKVPYVKITAEALLVFKPHGYLPGDFKSIPGSQIPTYEMYLNIKLNTDRLTARYGAETLDTGTYLTAAYSIAAMFRFGLFEAYESQEFYTVYVSPMEGDLTKFSVTGITAPKGLAAPADIPVGFLIDIGAVKAEKKMLEIAPGMCVAAGLNHYMFNHTTGGTIASGSVLTYLAMFGLIRADQERKVSEGVTSVFYEALHPVNKRAIANLFFKRSGVTTHGRSSSCMRYEQLRSDSFISMRLQPQPAGAHKAYVCAEALRRVIHAGLSPFLTWGNNLNDCIQLCSAVLHAGAESHIGAMYYLGVHGSTQSSSLDNYLPDLACFMQSMAKHDTLTMSPHLSIENAARASVSWQALMKDLKGADYTSTDPEVVRRFLSSQGKVFLNFDINKEEDWGKAAVQSAEALAAVARALE